VAEKLLRILIVDDEQRVLDGLQRMLRPMRGAWEVTTACGGVPALAHLDQHRVDVVVSDMRMPGMDGAVLLNEVRTRQPHAVRIILSGQSEQEAVMRSIGPAHRYLSKPCEPELFFSTVRRAVALRARLSEPSLVSLVTSLRTLPTPSRTYQDLVTELGRSGGSLLRAGEIIGGDVGLTAKLLQVVNSAFFGLARNLVSPAEAANLLGVETLRALVLALGLFDTASVGSDYAELCERLRHHAINVSNLARAIARAEQQPPAVCDLARSAGLLHDCGILVLSANLGGRYQEVLRSASAHRVPLHQAEQAVLGATHAQVGAYLLALWGLPDQLVEVIAYHHQPEHEKIPHFTALSAVHAADILIGKEVGECGFSEHHPFEPAYFAAMGLADGLKRWRELTSPTEKT
jgi:putative nucleotidyltransferase with HDIG domain